MGNESWKNLERKVAKELNGERKKRGNDFSQRDLDGESEQFLWDCKYRKSLNIFKWWDKLLKDKKEVYKDVDKIPLLALKEANRKGELVVLSLEDFVKLIDKGE